MPENISALILAAGFGSRLGSLSEELPKPMLPVCNIPLVKWASMHLRHYGIKSQGINLHHLGSLIERTLGDGSDFGVRIQYSYEPEILGTGGGVKKLASLFPKQTLLVMNAKLVLDLDLGEVIKRHRASKALATMVVREEKNAAAWGAINLTEDQKIASILDHKAPHLKSFQDYLFTGIHLLEPEFIQAIPEGPGCIIRTAYAELLKQGCPINGFIQRGYFYEHSTPQRYLLGNINLLQGKFSPPFSSDLLNGIHPTVKLPNDLTLIEPVLIGENVTLSPGVTIGPNVVIGPRAIINPQVTLKNCVVFPDGIVTESKNNCVVTKHSHVSVELESDAWRAPR